MNEGEGINPFKKNTGRRFVPAGIRNAAGALALVAALAAPRGAFAQGQIIFGSVTNQYSGAVFTIDGVTNTLFLLDTNWTFTGFTNNGSGGRLGSFLTNFPPPFSGPLSNLLGQYLSPTNSLVYGFDPSRWNVASNFVVSAWNPPPL